MANYIGKMLDDIPEDMRGKSETLHTYHLFDIAEDVAKRSQTKVDIFHHFMAQLLYMSKQ